MKNPIKMDDLGVFPYFWKHPYSVILGPSMLVCGGVVPWEGLWDDHPTHHEEILGYNGGAN